jgi:hypothetical protein
MQATVIMQIHSGMQGRVMDEDQSMLATGTVQSGSSAAQPQAICLSTMLIKLSQLATGVKYRCKLLAACSTVINVDRSILVAT